MQRYRSYMKKLNLFLLLFLVIGSIVQAMEEPTLLSASCEGDLEKVKELLAEDADIEMVDECGWTSLMNAATKGHLEVVQHLLKNGANVDARNRIGGTALIIASLYTNRDMATSSNLPIVKCLVQAGADLECKDREGVNALIRAAHLENLPVIQYLIEQGADVNCVDAGGETALIKAACAAEDNPAIVQCLMQAGARLTTKNKQGFTALFIAADWGNKLCCEALIKELLKIPNDKQKEKVILCTKAMMNAGIPIEIRFHVKPYLCFVIKQENKEFFAESFAYEEIDKFENESLKSDLLSEYQRVAM